MNDTKVKRAIDRSHGIIRGFFTHNYIALPKSVVRNKSSQRQKRMTKTTQSLR
jgi:hypothetical protein